MEGESSMFYCSSGSSVGSDPLSVSKSDISRGIITEKSSTAAREISAVVERTVADYEQEASGFRQEIDRQRRQSESSQPQVRSHRRRAEAGLPDSQSHEVVVVGEEEEQRGQQRSTGVSDPGVSDFLWYRDDDDHDEEKKAVVSLTQQPRQKYVDSKDPDYQIPPRVRPEKRRPSRTSIRDSQSHSDFKVRILEDPTTEVLSNNVFQKCPVQDLTCPRDLQESDFSNQSRSTFPQSATGAPFDSFMTDHQRRSKPSMVSASTPEEIYRTIKSNGNSALYIRLKTAVNPQGSSGDVKPCPGDQKSSFGSATHSADKPLIRISQKHSNFRVRLLEDPQTEVLSNIVFQKSPVQDVSCPWDLQESEFSDSSRSTFPQSAAGAPFDSFMTDHQRRSYPSMVSASTPEEIYRTIKSSGNSALYIRLKTAVITENSSGDVSAGPGDEESSFSSAAPTADKPLISDSQKHSDFRVRILEDPQIEVLSRIVFQKCPLQYLRCPRDSQESEFSDLSRSTFPQSAAGAPFDSFMTDHQRRSYPSMVSASTPEEIYRIIKSNGNSALYIRLKTAVITQSSNGDVQPCPGDEESSFSSATQSDDQPLISDSNFRVRISENPRTEVLSNNVFRKCPSQYLRCPRDLQESDFSNSSRSTFPQSAAGAPFDSFTTATKRRSNPSMVSTSTPEEIYRNIKSSGNSALYIRLKSADNPQSSSADVQPRSGDEESTFGSATISTDKPLIRNFRKHSDFRVRLLEDPQTEVSSNVVFQKSPVQDLTCPRDLQESDFSNSSRSAFPQLSAGAPFDSFMTDKKRRSHPLMVNASTPKEIYRNIKSSGHSSLYVRLKTGEDKDGEKEERVLQLVRDKPQSADCLTSEDETAPLQSPGVLQKSGGSSVADEEAAESDTGSEDGIEALEDDDEEWKPNPKEPVDPEDSKDPEDPKPRRIVKEGPRRIVKKGEDCKVHCHVCGVWYRTMSGLARHAWTHVDDSKSVCGVCGESFSSSEDLKGHLQVHQKTYDCSHCGKAFFTTMGLKNHVTSHTGEPQFKCNTCNKTFAYKSYLKVHRWVHVEDRPYKCDMCPSTFGFRGQLVAHKKLHVSRDRYLCNICGRLICDARSLARHKLTHSNERRFACKVCGKRFKSDCTSKVHEKVHTVRDRKYSCHVCSKTFVSRGTSTTHMKTHSGERPFVCSVCTKSFIQKDALRGHMRVHTGETPYGCSQCGRRFKTKSHLNVHVRSHLGIKRFTCGVCGKASSRRSHSAIHMRTHNGERPYNCSLCDKAFTQSHCSKTHMKSYHPEEIVLPEPSTSDVPPPDTAGNTEGL